MISKTFSLFTLALTLLMLTTPSLAYDINDQLSIGGVLSVAGQCQDLSDAPDSGNTCEWAAPFQPELSYRPTEVNELHFKLGFAAGNGLNDVTPFLTQPWAASLEDDVKNINGSDRDHLLTAWYKHRFNISDRHSLDTSFGIIDATSYLDENAYANDEYTQFMNAALTNGPNVFLPSYDLGMALEWEFAHWSLSGVLMNIEDNEDGNNTNFYGLQAGYHIDNSLGAGNYRAVITGSSEDFLTPDETRLVRRTTALLSLDQEFGSVIGGWLRLGWRTDDAADNYDALYSGGIDIKGLAWDRGADNIGIGYAFLNGSDADVDKTSIAEVYYRWQAGDLLGLTADIQYMSDDYIVGDGPKGWIYSLRATAEF